ncbi:MAG: hypothetical protein WA139_03815 [Candidatus Aenigmatarchaeota archaeon]
MATIFSALQGFRIEQILLFLLSFAIVYGLLKQYKIPKSNAAQAMIGLAIAFLVIMAASASPVINILKEMSANLIVVAVGILILIIFLEVAGVKANVAYKNPKAVSKENPEGWDSKPISIFERYGYAFAIVLGIIAILIFINAGGLGLIGMQNINLSGTSTMTVIFFIIILLAIFWLIGEKG